MLARPSGGNAAGFSLLELAAAIALVAIFATVLLVKLSYMQRLAEKTAVESMLKTLESGLVMEASAFNIRGQEHQIDSLLHQSPFLLLQPPPENYLGAWPQEASQRRPGSWYYDAVSGEVRYLPNGSPSGGEPLRYLLNRRPGRTMLIALVPQNSYDWRV